LFGEWKIALQLIGGDSYAELGLEGFIRLGKRGRRFLDQLMSRLSMHNPGCHALFAIMRSWGKFVDVLLGSRNRISNRRVLYIGREERREATNKSYLLVKLRNLVKWWKTLAR